MKQRKKSRKTGHYIGALILAFLLALVPICAPEPVLGNVEDNAFDFYQTYGNQVIFRSTSVTDGKLLYGTKGKISTAGITYTTIGWKVCIYNSGGGCLQAIYYSLSGNNVTRVDRLLKDGYDYNLYAITLSNLKSRMYDSVKRELERGTCKILLDACMVVKDQGTPKGGMTDSGPSWGSVYTTYEGIVNAQDWSDASRENLKSGFNKIVQGLMFAVAVGKDVGISSVSGGGTYCYGTKVTINATAATGYDFSYWSGQGRQTAAAYSFYVNGAVTWTAHATPKKLTVTFWRNQGGTDSEKKAKTYTYGVGGQTFVNWGWTKKGYHALGWALRAGAKKADYSMTNGITSAWIAGNAPKINLYCVWEPNRYTLRFDGNGAKGGKMPDQRVQYGQVISVPENGFVYTGADGTSYKFLGWSSRSTSREPEYREGESLSVIGLAEKRRLENTDNGVIVLYAVWDEVPILSVTDLYYSVSDAMEGKITEQELAAHMKARDREDGEIAYGIHAKNSFSLRDFRPEDFLNFKKEGSVTETCVAVDSSGNRAMKTFTVHLVDTEAKIGDFSLGGRLRFISLRYYEKSGSLSENSVWRKKEEYRRLLEEALGIEE